MRNEKAERHASARGFARVVELFPDEIAEAALQAAKQRAQLSAPDELTSEPWPPMQCQSR